MSAVSQEVYGRLPGVRTLVVGGGISNIAIGREQKLVMFGRGDPASGTANANEPTQIETRADAGRIFGQGTELADEIVKALSNKGNIDYIYGVMPSEITVQGEAIANGSGTLVNAPIIEDKTLITVTDTSTTPAEHSVEFRYESPPEAPADADTVAINPLSGEFNSGDALGYTVDYSYLDWATAFNAADPVLNHHEVGVYAALIDSEAVADTLADKLTGTAADDGNNGLRGEYKLAVGVVGAEPNITTAEGEAGIDPATYNDAIDNEAMFLPGPVRLSGDVKGRTIIGGIAGLMAGNALDNPIRGDRIRGYTRLTQSLTRDQEDAFRDNHQVIPVQDDYRDGGEGITLEGHHSTSTRTDWARTHQNRRIVDLIVLAQRSVAEASIDTLMRDEQLEEIEAQVTDVFEDFARAGLIRGDPDGETRGTGIDSLDDYGRTGTTQSGEEEIQQPYFVEATRTDIETISVGSGFSPMPVITGVENRIQIADVVGDLSGSTTTVTGGS